jgi:hypothetical protein
MLVRSSQDLRNELAKRKLRLTGGRLVVDLVPFTFSFQSSASNKVQLRRTSWIYKPGEGWVIEQPATDVTQ